MRKIRVLIVDDSAVVRQTLEDILSSDPQIEVMGTAVDPYVAAERMKKEVPDVITLDIEMPRMDGLTFLRKLMKQHPIPVVICSSVAGHGTENALKALEYGAIEIISKPKVGTKKFLEESSIRLIDKVKAAALAGSKSIKPAPQLQIQPKLSADAVIPHGKVMPVSATEKICLVGASTGGTEALRVYLEAQPVNCPPIAIVQHMPEHFTAAFANRLNSICQISVKEAKDGDPMLRGQALIAPGDKHMLLKRSGVKYYVEVKDGPLVSRHRPSVDVLFRSGARYGGSNVVSAIMTGMGDDGARGMKELKDAGAYTIAQDEASCVVFGMPQEAIKHGGVDKVLPLDRIAAEMIRNCGQAVILQLNETPLRLRFAGAFHSAVAVGDNVHGLSGDHAFVDHGIEDFEQRRKLVGMIHDLHDHGQPFGQAEYLAGVNAAVGSEADQAPEDGGACQAEFARFPDDGFSERQAVVLVIFSYINSDSFGFFKKFHGALRMEKVTGDGPGRCLPSQGPVRQRIDRRHLSERRLSGHT
eukprot:TRINITY_DN18762_c0_g3_i1.p1 TRINITY_DN18762_c0_g3~~TRINITY_DN18762_c0_g3_i1.p1  ORF type:complete len:528 (-),score=102.36 TRINITY_DN18762_c0_g3_i1:366-1949(-)